MVKSCACKHHHGEKDMEILPLRYVPDPILKKISLSIENIDEDIRKMAKTLVHNMYHYDGCGLAAIQVGIDKRCFILDLSNHGYSIEKFPEETDIKYPLIIINPEIISFSEDKFKLDEGCCSVPTIGVEVERPSEIQYRYVDYDGNLQEGTGRGMFARAFQHEMDHLNGITLINYLSPLKADISIRKVQKLIRSK